MKILVLCGPSGCGKSTWAKNYCEVNLNTVIVSSDGIREELWGDESIQDNPRLVFELAYKRIRQYLAAGADVIFDATNLTKKIRKNFIKSFTPTGAELICVYFHTGLEECKAAQLKRERKVPEEVIEKQFKNFSSPTADEGWKEIWNYNCPIE